MQFLVVFLFF